MASAHIDREWLDLRELAIYAAVSDRTLRTWLRLPDPLPAVRVGGKILIRRSEFNKWLENHRIQPDEAIDVDAIVTSLFKDAE